MPKTLIFDWDGTLHNTKALYGRAFRAAYAWLVANGHAAERDYTDDEVACYLGMNAPDMWQSFMPDLPTPVWQHASALIGKGMIDQIEAGQAVLFTGAVEVLTQLKQAGHNLVFLSNCKRAYMQAHTAAFDLERYFDGFYCCEDYAFAPKTEIFRHIAAAFPGPYCMIGDRSSDLAVGRVWDFPTVACTYGYGTAEEWAAATLRIDDIRQLPERIAAFP